MKDIWFALVGLYGGLYIVLMDLALVHFIHAFEGVWLGHDLRFFTRTLTIIYSPHTLNLLPTPTNSILLPTVTSITLGSSLGISISLFL